MLVKNEIENENHFVRLKSLFSNADKVVIASPYLAEKHQISRLLNGLNADQKVKEITIVTVLEGYGKEAQQLESLLKFVEYCESEVIRWRVYFHERTNGPKLHGKVYMFYKNGSPQSFLITSANFTQAGLTGNHEYGVLIDCGQDPDEAKSLERWLIGNRKYVLKQQLEALHSEVGNEPASPQPDPARHRNLGDILENKVSLDSQCFIKPYGSAGNHIDLSDIADLNFEDQYFSRKNNSLGEGAIGIDYAVTDNPNEHPILGLFRLTTGQFIDDPDNDRWPHYKESENLVPEYTEKVKSTHKALCLEKCADEFHNLEPYTNIKHDEPRLQSLTTRFDHGMVTAAFTRYIESRIKAYAYNSDGGTT